jgi:hypothetical protein
VPRKRAGMIPEYVSRVEQSESKQGQSGVPGEQ